LPQLTRPRQMDRINVRIAEHSLRNTQLTIDIIKLCPRAGHKPVCCPNVTDLSLCQWELSHQDWSGKNSLITV